MTRFAVVLILLLGFSASAQKTRAPEQWVKYEFDNGAISILSPLKLNAVEAVIPAELPLSKTVIATGADAGRVFRVTFSIQIGQWRNRDPVDSKAQCCRGSYPGRTTIVKDCHCNRSRCWPRLQGYFLDSDRAMAQSRSCRL